MDDVVTSWLCRYLFAVTHDVQGTLQSSGHGQRSRYTGRLDTGDNEYKAEHYF